MRPNISHLFLSTRLIAENVLLKVDYTTQKLMIIDESRPEEVYRTEQIKSLEFFFKEVGPLSSSYFETYGVLTFTDAQCLFDWEIDYDESVVFVIKGAFKEFESLQNLFIRFQEHLKSSIVRLLPIIQSPSCVFEVLDILFPYYSGDLMDRIEQDEVIPPTPSTFSTKDCVSLSSGDYDEMPSPPLYYNIDGERTQITPEGISSLDEGAYMNDEVVNIAFTMIQNRYPHVHIFNTYIASKIFAVFQNGSYEHNLKMSEAEFNSSFGQLFFNKRIDGKQSNCQRKDSFFDKKMLIFPFCHHQHWFIVVVVNPLYSDVIKTEDSKPSGRKSAAFYLDSLKGPSKLSVNVMLFRLEVKWRCIFTFLRLAALFHSHSHMNPDLVMCEYDTNLPSQVNNFDCGPHAIVNAQVMAEMYDKMMVNPSINVSEKKVEEVRYRVGKFRRNMRDYLAKAKV
ncbi:hypothetical protein PFISCL1PPCAC_24378 [Pristionchus fissidentatus]|uniref:Ubiquitin-like protease family profile domain-containing protein n=1 Tax=Pristionchus fissidentatus TaxID=1538716 RepID=A0AAV5WQ00_9BILA|nr:hypothetical protein PFISCL1PPCAC_24378 [Pristionchus fissidentatus]